MEAELVMQSVIVLLSVLLGYGLGVRSVTNDEDYR